MTKVVMSPGLLAQKHLLPPPSVGLIFLEGYHGQGDDYIGVVAAHDFGIHSMCITVLDDRGCVLESGEMWPLPQDPNGWEYLPEARVPPGTAVTVHVTAMRGLHGLGEIIH